MSNYSQELVENLTRIRKEYKTIRENCPQLVQYLNQLKIETSWLGAESNFRERIYVVINDIVAVPTCFVCGHAVKFNIKAKEYPHHCCKQCVCDSDIRKENEKLTKSNWSDEKRNSIIDKKIKASLITVNNRTPEQKKAIGDKIKNIWNEFTEEEKQKILLKRIKTQESWTDEFRQEISNKLIELWNNRTDEEKQKMLDKRLITINNKTDEEKQETIQKKMDVWNNKTDEEKQEIIDKILTTKLNWSEEYKQEVFTKKSKSMSLAHSNRTDEEKRETIKKQMSTSFSSKDYILPSGNIIKIQGNENLALDELLESYNEEDIISCWQNPIIIPYVFNNKNKNYFPDIFIPQENKIIEIKSTYTYEKEPDKNIAKFEATKNAGYVFECWVYNKKKEKIIIY
jgi:hypothetical protein